MDAHGYIKRVRFVLRLFINSTFFDNFLTACVLLNTITMAMDGPLIDAETETFLENADQVFTWIFIVEMGIKLLGIGIYKYTA